MVDENEMQLRLEERAKDSREMRDYLLSRCDWTHSVSDWDVPQKEEWRLYRASLRDLPLHPLFPELNHNSDEYPRPPNNPAQIIQKYLYVENPAEGESVWQQNPDWVEPTAPEEPAE